MRLTKKALNKVRNHYLTINFMVVTKSIFKNRIIKKANQEKICLLMNGPSLIKDIEDVDLSKTDMLVVNHFSETEFFTQFKPALYVIQDSYFWNSNVDEKYIKKRNAAYDALNKKTTWKLKLYFPSFVDLDFVKSKITNTNIEILTYYAGYLINNQPYFKSIVKDSRFLFFLWRCGHAAPPPENVIVAATYLPFLLGYKEAFLFGANMSFFNGLEVNQETNEVGIWHEHFYDKEFAVHYKDKQCLNKTTMAHELEKWGKVFKTFEVLDNFYSKNDFKVYNAGNISYIDAFERKKL